jgi:hypothetical protein
MKPKKEYTISSVNISDCGMTEIIANNNTEHLISLKKGVAKKYLNLPYTVGTVLSDKDLRDFIAIVKDKNCETDVFYVFVKDVLSSMYSCGFIDQSIFLQIAKDIFSYRTSCIKRYNNTKRSCDDYNAMHFLNKYREAILVFDLHGGKNKCKQHLIFINLCWDYLNKHYNREDTEEA